MEIPPYLKRQYTETEIRRETARMGAEILPWTKQVSEESGEDVLGIPVLRGGIFFFVDLVREIDHSVDIAPVRSWAYEPGKNEAQTDEVLVNLDGVNPKGRSILLVDDLCDSGRTLKKLSKLLTERGAKDVRTAVLIQRELQEPIFDPTYVGFQYSGAEWFVGCGMEDGTRFRNLRDVYIIEKN